MAVDELDQIAQEVSVCTRCPLSKGRCNAVPGEGAHNAKIMFIGEGPGYHEDQQGRPFVGPSGQLLDQLFTKIKLKREDVFISNVVKCRPPNNRDPEPPELEACKTYLDRQIEAINPRLVITLGRISMARYWPGQRISAIHGQPKIENGRMYMAMFHPSFALRDRNGPGMQKFKEDGLNIPSLLSKAEEIAATELWGAVVQDQEGVTLPLADTISPDSGKVSKNSAHALQAAKAADIFEVDQPNPPSQANNAIATRSSVYGTNEKTFSSNTDLTQLSPVENLIQGSNEPPLAELIPAKKNALSKPPRPISRTKADKREEAGAPDLKLTASPLVEVPASTQETQPGSNKGAAEEQKPPRWDRMLKELNKPEQSHDKTLRKTPSRRKKNQGESLAEQLKLF